MDWERRKTLRLLLNGSLISVRSEGLETPAAGHADRDTNG